MRRATAIVELLGLAGIGAGTWLEHGAGWGLVVSGICSLAWAVAATYAADRTE